MPPSPRDKLQIIVEDAHEAVVRARERAGAEVPAELGERLADAGFPAPESAGHFASVTRILLDAGAGDDAIVDLLDACRTSASPDAALLNLNRYLENAGGAPVFMSTIVPARPLRDMVVTVFGASQYLSDIIVRNPSTVYWLMENSTWTSPDTVESYREWFEHEAGMFQSTASRLDAIRRTHRRALLKIGILDLEHGEPVESIATRLSNLADAVVAVALRVICEDVGIDPGGGQGLAVIALGKLGGRELNYSSDIDVIYTCEDTDDETMARYTKAARRLTDALSELTGEGYLYRVDLRLRPDGQSGPMVNSASSLRVYYENRGRPWEFQAMLKARVIAGNVALGERLLEAIAGLAFNPSLSYSPLDDIARMRVQIKESIPAHERGANIKLMAGGIRDVEFIAQTLQLLHGHRHRELRTPNTLEALSGIRRLGLLDDWQVDNLADAYRFFRIVEHRLQMMHQIKTHTVPESEGEIALLARRLSRGPLGRFSSDEFLDTLSRHLANVRHFAESFFAGEEVHPHSVLLMLPEGDERAQAIIGQYGIRDVRRAMRVLHGMAYGSFPRLLDRGARAAFEELLPLLLEEVSTTGDPDQTLVHVSQIAAAGRSETTLYRMMVSSPAARDVVVGIAATSSLVTRKLCAQIGMLESLLQSPRSLADELHSRPLPARDFFDAGDAAAGGDRAAGRLERQRAWVDRLRIAGFVADYRGRFRDRDDDARRAAIAQRMLAAAFDDALGDVPVALFVLGSYAVGEPRLASDADVIVVSDGADIPTVTERVQLINRWFSDGGVLKLDFRLRGEGASSPLVQDLSYYESYLEKRLSLWERIALAKCRAWWGPESVRRRFQEALRRAVARPFTRNEVGRLATMRERVEGLAPKRFGVWETKRSAGGRYDIEYLTAIALARADGDDFTLSTRERIERVAEDGALTGTEADECLAALDLFGVVERLMEFQGISHPASKEKAEYLRTYLDRTLAFLEVDLGGDNVENALDGAKKAVRRCYQNALDRLV